MNEAGIDVSGLRKRFGPTLALDGMSFAVQPGQVTGFIGPNGAGKSTTMRVILGLDAADAGTALIGGRPYPSLRRPLTWVGSLLDAGALQPSRTARNHLLWLARSQGLAAKRVDEVIGQAGLEAVARRRAGGFSLGMRQRLGIAAALLGDPPVLMLDEPFNGMDPEGIVWMRGFLRALAAQGRAVLVSSHLMSELQDTAGHLVIVGRGKVIADTSTAELLARSIRRPGHAAHHRGPAGRRGAGTRRGSRHRSSHGNPQRGRTGRRAGRCAAVRQRGAVLRGLGPPGLAGRGLPRAHRRRGRLPGRTGRGGRPMSAGTMTPARPDRRARRGGFWPVLQAEWIKFRTVRGWVIAMVIAALVTVGIALLDHSSCGGQAVPGGPVVVGLGCSAPLGPGGEAVTDNFYFVHQPLDGNGSITARVTSLTAGPGPAGLQPWSKAGIIVEAGARPGSAYAAMMVTAGHGVRMQYDYTGDIAGFSRRRIRGVPAMAAAGPLR